MCQWLSGAKQVEQRQVDRQNFLIAALSRALVHIAAEPVNSVEGLIEFFQQDVSAVDGECQFSILPSSLTLFPVNVQHMHAVIVSPGKRATVCFIVCSPSLQRSPLTALCNAGLPGLDMVERTESIRTVLMANGGYNREFTHVLSGSEATTPNVSKVLRVIQSTRPEFAAGTAKLLLILLAEVCARDWTIARSNILHFAWIPMSFTICLVKGTPSTEELRQRTGSIAHRRCGSDICRSNPRTGFFCHRKSRGLLVGSRVWHNKRWCFILMPSLISALAQEHGMLSVREVTSICSVLSKHEAEVTVLVGARYRRRSQVRWFASDGALKLVGSGVKP